MKSGRDTLLLFVMCAMMLFVASTLDSFKARKYLVSEKKPSLRHFSPGDLLRELDGTLEKMARSLTEGTKAPAKKNGKEGGDLQKPQPEAHSAETYFTMAKDCWKRKDYRKAATYGETAVTCWIEAKASREKILMGREFLAKVYEALKDYENAKVQYTLLAGMNPGNSLYRVKLAELKKREDEKRLSSVRALESQARAEKSRGNHLGAMDLAEKAVNALERTGGPSNEKAAMYALQGDCARILGNPSQAANFYTQALSLNPANSSYRASFKTVSSQIKPPAAVRSSSSRASYSTYPSSSYSSPSYSRYPSSSLYVSPSQGSLSIPSYYPSGTYSGYGSSSYSQAISEQNRSVIEAYNARLRETQARNQAVINSYNERMQQQIQAQNQQLIQGARYGTSGSWNSSSSHGPSVSVPRPGR
ncbi:MAG: tetratricopeptide repeat protein [Candidatus Eremiobacteraeota bacterium]|nr:tetratricopeptide repeat protein [Candidatus Eremiobacteraeota bacterium]